MGPLATVSTVKTLKEPLGKDHAVGIKWMNDVIVNNKKIDALFFFLGIWKIEHLIINNRLGFKYILG